ncbi:flagellar export protein FliJ [Aquibacillus koreensis]|uniref:Flagellar FliJ protein n=1 Tax=Aquibacillus koreensis TaxID=279446 RepID=A0A9X4AKZ2_9BACI|nr:flagellar export protein FliJ [Aquibacillus koreensis]MCT2534523.1 flagellar export protein FliJ [Aquibacillus koreensis]MDC3421883.1 flagellar export protein FliJ [Aquibacillus koreensis]
MASAETFQKILGLREREKNDAQMAYKDSVDSFEEFATQLYHLLRKKEKVEREYSLSLGSTSSVSTLTTHYTYIEKIKENIRQLEMSVKKARNNMEMKQKQLTATHIEVKKYEKLIERKEKKRIELQKAEETKLMDETSIMQFLNNRDR